MEDFDIKSIITKEAYEQLIQLSKEAVPNEVCGIVASSMLSEQMDKTKDANQPPIIDTVIPIANNHINPTHSFSFDPVEWTAVYYEMQKNRQSLVGLFHSHPRTAAIPSSSDIEGFLPASQLSYWIISLENAEAPHIQPYRRVQGAFIPMQLVLA